MKLEYSEDEIEKELLYKHLGVHKEESDRGEVYIFRAYNEKAERAELAGDFNLWGRTPMKKVGDGIFEVKIESDASIEETCYKYRFYTDRGMILASDRYASYSQNEKGGASIVYLGSYEWNDSEWMRGEENKELPVNIYELDLGTWCNNEEKGFGVYPNYRDVAVRLAVYASDMGYTHLCLLPITEEKSPFAPTSRYGRPDDFKFFVDTMHGAKIGVILEGCEPDTVMFWKNEFHVDGFMSQESITIGERFFYIDTAWSDQVMDYAETGVKYKKYKYYSLNRALVPNREGHRVISVPCTWVSEGKRSLFEKMQGDVRQSFARMRLFYSFMMLQKGSKMTFMGCEYGEKNEWNKSNVLDWFLSECEANARLKSFTRALNHLYLSSPELWCDESFKWISRLSPENDLMAFSRGRIVAVFNFGDVAERELVLDSPMDVLLASDDEKFGGEGNSALGGEKLTVSPLSAVILVKKEPFFEKTIDYSRDM